VVDLSSSSDEEDLIPDTSWDEDFARRLFDNINREILWPPDDEKIIILSDSDEEEEVRKEDVADAEAAPPSAVKSSAPIASAANADDASGWLMGSKNLMESRWLMSKWFTTLPLECDSPPPKKAGVCLPRSYRGILDEARIHKHNT
jgi:hypothetical protein